MVRFLHLPPVVSSIKFALVFARLVRAFLLLGLGDRAASFRVKHMHVTLLALSVLNLAFSVLLFCCGRAIWARLPAPVVLTAEELAEVAAYREKWAGVVDPMLPDDRILFMSRHNL